MTPQTLRRRLRRIGASLRELEALDANREVFGADTHQYRRIEAVDETDLARWEKRQGVTLSEEYRAFIVQLFAGGPGPGYGLLPLDVREKKFASLGRPFPWGDDEALHALAQRRKELKKGPFCWFGYEFERYPDGCLTLNDYGCAWNGELVLTGPQRGRVWYVGDNAFPLAHRWRPTGFLDWYQDWIDESLAELRAKA